MKTLALFIIAAMTLLSGCASSVTSPEVELMKKQLAEVMKTRQDERVNLDNFDDLDFNVFSGQLWESMGKSHSKDIVVH